LAEIKAVVTEDARRYWPQLLAGSLGTPISPTVFVSHTDILLNLSVGDLFLFSGDLYRVISVTDGGPVLPPAGSVWAENVATGAASPMSTGTVVVRQLGYSVMPIITTFKIGEGGWVDLGAGAFPREPDSTLRRLDNNIQDIDAIVDGTRIGAEARYPLNSRNFFEKRIDPAVPGNIQFVAPTTIRVKCRLESAEFNDDGFGNNPDLWEIALFSEHPTLEGERLMIAYGTFPQQTKTNSVIIENFVEITF
jgi:hypothetical protein